ncbi:MAG: Fic family protein [Xanthomonadales bacterium]|nr:Fic family protein [Xanthomonadales bacterium]
MHSLEPNFLDSLRFSAEQLKTIRAIGDARGRQALWYQQVPEVLKNLRMVAQIESTESSNRIEGVTVSPERLEPLVLKRTDPRNRSEQEVAGYRDVLGLIHDSATEMQFSANVMLQLHGILYRYLPDEGGHWKSAPNGIIEKHPDGSRRIRFKPSPPQLVQIQIDKLCSNFTTAQTDGREPLVVVALSILDFLCIHPFLDANGRVGRLLTLMLLYQFDYQVGRYISLERVIEQSKETYYEALEASSQDWHEGQHNVMPWLNYFWGMLLRAYGEFRERLDAVHPQGHGSKTELVRHAVLKRKKPFTLSAIEDECLGVSRDMVRHVLRQMREEGLVEVNGRGRAARWALTDNADIGNTGTEE